MRTTRREIRGLLERAGERAPAAPAAGFRLDLEHRLLRTSPPGRLVALPVPPRRARRPGVLSGAAAAAAAAVLIGALTGVYGHGIDEGTLALAVAVDTVVQLPDGTTIAGEQGLALPDGAVVRTGPNGHCAAGDVEIGPGLEAFVDAGHLRLRMVPPAGTGETSPTVGSLPRTEPPVTVPSVPTTVPDPRTTVSTLLPAPSSITR